MPLVPEIEFDDIVIAEEHTGGHEYERCKAALWGIYNVIKKIVKSSSDTLPPNTNYNFENIRKTLECLLMIGVNAKFENASMASLVYGGKASEKYKRGMPAAQYLFQLENYGFAFADILSLRNDVPRHKLPIKDIAQFTFSYSAGDFSDVIFGLKLFADVCMKKNGAYFYTGDIRAVFANAPKLYSPPVDEVFWFLPDEQKKAALLIHDKLEDMGCVRSFESGYMLKYMHRKNKKLSFATIYVSDQLYFLPESERHIKIAFKFNFRNIGSYVEYLDNCTDAIRQTILQSTDCFGCKKACGGIAFQYNGKNYSKCPFSAFRFLDFSEQATENYVRLLELENNAMLT